MWVRCVQAVRCVAAHRIEADGVRRVAVPLERLHGLAVLRVPDVHRVAAGGELVLLVVVVHAQEGVRAHEVRDGPRLALRVAAIKCGLRHLPELDGAIGGAADCGLAIGRNGEALHLARVPHEAPQAPAARCCWLYGAARARMRRYTTGLGGHISRCAGL